MPQPRNQERRQWPLSWQIIGAFTAVIILVGFIMGEFERMAETERLSQNLHKRDARTVALLSAVSLDAVISEDRPLIESIIEQAVLHTPEIVSVIYENETGKVLASWKNEKPVKERFLRTFSNKIEIEGETFGSVTINWNIEPGNQLIQNYVNQTRFYTAASLLIITIVFLALLQWLVLRPISGIHRRLEELSERRNLSPLTLSPTSSRELENLAKSTDLLVETLEELRESEERFRTLIDSSSQGILVHRHYRPLYANRTLVEMFGYDNVEEVLALGSADILFAPGEKSRMHGYHEACLRGEFAPKDREFKGLRKDGSKIWLDNRAFRIDWVDGPAICTTLFDVTERKNTQAQLVQATKLATLGEMASGIAHELNQPLTAVGVAAENSLLSIEEDGCDTEFLRGKLKTIVRQIDRMGGIINHMRQFSRKDNSSLEWFDPLEAVAGAVGLIGEQFRAVGVGLERDLPATSRKVSGHPMQLEQVVLNLLTNARDAVLGKPDSAKSVTRNPAPTVRVSMVDDMGGDTVVISVADNGGGIPESAFGRIFDPFFTTKAGRHGTGLGLSISYSIIDAVGGRLEAENVDGGAIFRITLPVSADEPSAVDSPPPE